MHGRMCICVCVNVCVCVCVRACVRVCEFMKTQRAQRHVYMPRPAAPARSQQPTRRELYRAAQNACYGTPRVPAIPCLECQHPPDLRSRPAAYYIMLDVTTLSPKPKTTSTCQISAADPQRTISCSTSQMNATHSLTSDRVPCGMCVCVCVCVYGWMDGWRDACMCVCVCIHICACISTHSSSHAMEPGTAAAPAAAASRHTGARKPMESHPQRAFAPIVPPQCWGSART